MNCYEVKQIPKGNGKYRILEIPADWLKRIQTDLLLNVLDGLYVSPAAHGFVKGRSAFTNAACHVCPLVLVTLDITDFFPSITEKMVVDALRDNPLPEDTITDIVTHCVFKNHLPQGAPTSPMLANLVCWKLDRNLTDLARRSDAIYTRYADDLTFSSKWNDRLPDIIPEVCRLLKNSGLSANPRKTKVAQRHQRMEVTGYVVNEKVNLPREYARRVRAKFHQAGPESDLNELVGHASYVQTAKKKLGKAYFERLKSIRNRTKRLPIRK